MYDLGAVAVLTWTTLDTAGAAANAAATPVLTVTLPDTTTATPTVTSTGTGTYQALYATSQAGRHTYRWTALTGTPGPGVGYGSYVDSLDVWPGVDDSLISLADAKVMLNIAANVTTFDAKIRSYIKAITAFIERFCGPVIPQQVTERQRAGGMFIALEKPPVYQPAGQQYPIIAMTPVLTYGLVYDLSLLTVDKARGIVRHSAGLPFIYGPYDFTYTAGRIPVPDEILLSSETILKHQWAQERGGRAAGGAAASAVDDVTVMWGFAVPQRALEMLEPQRAPGGIA